MVPAKAGVNAQQNMPTINRQIDIGMKLRISVSGDDMFMMHFSLFSGQVQREQEILCQSELTKVLFQYLRFLAICAF
jgi:hypothetical protein